MTSESTRAHGRVFHEAWAWLALALPFLVTALLLHCLQTTIFTFHWTDESDFHWPVILKFAGQWPWLDFSDYQSATTPLFHVVFAALGKLLGFDLPTLRAVNVLVSFLVGLVYKRLLTEQLKFDGVSAVLAALAFVLSPYFFGVSFVLLTDNLAWLFGMLSLLCLLRFSSRGAVGAGVGVESAWCFGCLCLALTLLTRQSFAWLALVFGGVGALAPGRMALRLGRLAVLGLSTMPMLALFYRWHGPLPPSFQNLHESQQWINPRALGFSFAVLGLYAWPLLWAQLDHSKGGLLALLFGGLTGMAWLLLMPLPALSNDDGFLWRASWLLPQWQGASVMFWFLVPSGAAAFVHLLWRRPDDLGLWAFVAFTATMLHSGILFQKYFDPFIPLFLMLSRGDRSPSTRLAEKLVWAAMALGGVAYAGLPYLKHPAAA